MPIINNELVNTVPFESYESPDINVGDFFLDRIKRNIEKCGDAEWMVSYSTH